MNSQFKVFATHLLNGDQDAGWLILLEEMKLGKTSSEIYQDLVTQALVYIGQLWEENLIRVADEHLASATCDFLLTRYYFHKKGIGKFEVNNKKSLFFCLDQEQHYLGLKMVSLLFEEAGWDSRFLGANLPLEYAMSMAVKWKPDLIGISFTTLYTVEQLSLYISGLESLEHRPDILLGGRLVSKYPFFRNDSSSIKVIEKLSELECWLEDVK